jgi:ATP-dependent RNA helicase RhlE
VKIPEGDKAVYEKLPPPQKETPESEMRNARGRMSRGDAEKRASKSREKQPRDAEKPAEGMPHKHRRRNRPGSRARRRMREANGQSMTQ